MSVRQLAIILILLMILIVGVTSAVETPRNEPQETSPPVEIFVGETLNIADIELTDGGTIGSSSVTLVGTAGEANGQVRAIDDPTSAEFGRFAPGLYDAESDEDKEGDIAVTKPSVTDVTVNNQNGANVTNRWDPTGENLIVVGEFNFEQADRLDLTVTGPESFDVTKSVASSISIINSGDSIDLDLSGEDNGVFEITLEGSDLERASQTVTLRTGPRNTPTPTETPSGTPTPTESLTPTETITTREPPTQTATITETSTETATASPPTTPTQTLTQADTPGESGPGFSVVLAIGAFVLTVIMLLRR